MEKGEKKLPEEWRTTILENPQLILRDSEILNQSDQNKIDFFSSLIISNIQKAWRKPINIQGGLICDMRLTINKNGRIVKINLIRSSGNLSLIHI